MLDIPLQFVAGLLVGGILGSGIGFSREVRLRVASISTFGLILTASVGGGLYLFGPAQINILFEFSIALSIGFIIPATIGSIYIRYKYRPFAIVVGPPDDRLVALTEKYGKGFIDLDVEILDALEKGKRTVQDIATFVDEKDAKIKERIKFMKKKGVERKWQ